MTDYPIDLQWAAFTATNVWGSIWCRDVQRLLLTFMQWNSDRDYILGCTDEICPAHRKPEVECCVLHIQQPPDHGLCLLAMHQNSRVLFTYKHLTALGQQSNP